MSIILFVKILLNVSWSTVLVNLCDNVGGNFIQTKWVVNSQSPFESPVWHIRAVQNDGGELVSLNHEIILRITF